MIAQLTSNKNALLYIILICITFVLLIPYLKDVALILFLSGTISIMLYSLEIKFENYGISPDLSLMLCMISLITIISLFIFKLIPVYSIEFNHMNQIIEPNVLLSNLKNSLNLQINSHTIHFLIDQYSKFINFLFSRTKNLFFDDSSLLVISITIPVFVFLILRDGARLKRNFLQMLPNIYFEPIMQLFIDIKGILFIWLKEQLIMILIVGVLATVALSSLRVPYPFILGLALGLSHLIPYFGSFIGAIIILTVILLDSGSILTAVALIIALALIRLIYKLLFLSLRSMSIIKVHPIFIIILLLIGASMWGFFGLLFTIPFTTVFFIIIKQSFTTLSDYNLI
ncbi:AI-2E family transporter [candidate division KSB1 bacterium]|nr:AI-2E family transporter [candidate division KSB1 bacterium]